MILRYQMRVVILGSMPAILARPALYLFFAFTSCVVSRPSYFPIRKGVENMEVSQLEADWYSQNLSRMREPNLIEASREGSARSTD